MSDRLTTRLTRASRAPELPEGALDRFRERALDEGLVDVTYALTESPIGDFLVAATDRGLVKVAFTRGRQREEEALAELADKVSPALLHAPERLDDVRRQLDEYFAGERRRFELKLDRRLMGPFARKVLNRTARIPYGRVSTYMEVAHGAGSPRAYRAAGNALAKNPIPIVVPCHRVLASGGGLGGYGGGPDNKRWLLDLEGADY
jgi:methylated-DNA-[protein]-cysteine S-methyltransferase